MNDTISMRCGDLSAEIVPGIGAGLARFDHGDTPLFRRWMDRDRRRPFDLACNLLVPWSNRISGGGFVSDGQFHELAPNVPGEPFPIHGNGFASEWTVEAVAIDGATLSFVSKGPGPYQYRASVTYALTENSLEIALQVANQAAMRLPFGLGIHPWLTRTRLTTLQAPATEVCRELPNHLPDRFEDVALHPEWDFREPSPLPVGWINNAFAGWGGRASIVWPEYDCGLTIEASPPLKFYLVYSPSREADFFCFEPVSHVVDAHNLPSPAKWNGLSMLDVGETLEARCRFEVT